METKAFLENILAQFPNTQNKIKIQNLLQNIEKHCPNRPNSPINTPQVNLNIEINNIENFIEKLEQYCNDKQKLKIEIKDSPENKTITVIPLEIIFKKNRFIFSTYSQTSGNIINIPLNKIIKIEQYPTITTTQTPLSTISFELKDRLAKAYNLKDGERIIDIKPNGNIIITNNLEDKDELIERLLRYGKYCEIITPKSIRDEIQTILKNALENYK